MDKQDSNGFFQEHYSVQQYVKVPITSHGVILPYNRNQKEGMEYAKRLENYKRYQHPPTA